MSPKTNPSPEVIVIGGGVVGLATAEALHAAGLEVCVFERGSLAGEASWAGGGILAPLPPWGVSDALWALCQEGAARYPQWIAALHRESEIDPEWWPCGMEVRGEDAAIAADWLNARQLSHTRSDSSLWLPWVSQVRNPRLCRALVVALRRRGVLVQDQLGEVHLRVDDRMRSVSVWAQGQRYQPRAIVVAAGAWSTPLLAATGWQLPLRPIKGQMLALAATPGVVPHIILEGGRYLIPRRDGVVLVGSTLEDVGFNRETTPEAAHELSAFAQSVAPQLHGATVLAHWAGLRPGSPDGLPLMQEHPRYPRLFVHAGHFRYGLTMAPATASMLAAQVALSLRG